MSKRKDKKKYFQLWVLAILACAFITSHWVLACAMNQHWNSKLAYVLISLNVITELLFLLENESEFYNLSGYWMCMFVYLMFCMLTVFCWVWNVKAFKLFKDFCKFSEGSISFSFSEERVKFYTFVLLSNKLNTWGKWVTEPKTIVNTLKC